MWAWIQFCEIWQTILFAFPHAMYVSHVESRVYSMRGFICRTEISLLSRKWFSCVKLYFEGDLVGIFVWMLMSLLISQVSAANGITPQPPVSGAVNLTSRKAPYKSRRRPLQVRFPCWKTMYVKWTFIHGKLTWNRHCVSRSPVDSSSHQLRLWQAECQHRAEMLISWCLAAKSATYYKACHQMAQKITNDSLSRGP